MKFTHQKIVLAIDPGHAKCGMALVEQTSDNQLKLLWHTIASPEELIHKIEEASRIHSFKMFIIGSGTNSKSIIETLRDYKSGIGILVVDEKNTTLQARERYWEHNPRRGWRRLLPAALQAPPVPVDDYVAFILAERILSTE